ncbi:ParB N-terminal domain-containing protein [Burkholderia ubonensis]|uniref:ParB N-terminal domain-containing protein n=1 Tax=Burkholderia ubonensis TaxID=101571 RepID=UPI0009B41176|nr:ParB N-terminal domain-containing protein [Burkholderia ubonensis]
MKAADLSAHSPISVFNNGVASTKRSSDSKPTIVGRTPATQIFRVEPSGATVERLKGGESKRLSRTKRALQEPKQHINESYQDYQERRTEAGFPASPQEQPRSPWNILGEVLLGLLFGGPGGIRVGRRPIPPHSSPRPTPRPSVTSDSRPLIRPNPRPPSSIKPQSLPVKPEPGPSEAGRLPIGEDGVRISESGAPSEPASEGNGPVNREPQPLTLEDWNRQSKDGLDGDLKRKIDEAFEDGQDVRIYTSKNGQKTYLIYDEFDEIHYSIQSGETWYTPDNYDYEKIRTWRTGKPDQKYASAGKFDRGRNSLDGQRMGSVIKAIKNGELLDPVKVRVSGSGEETRFEIVDGNHRYHAACVLKLDEIPYQIVS